MKIKELHIENYKSLVDLKIVEPNPFTVFAGSNGAGKSNIFEALEFFNLCINTDVVNAVKSLGGGEDILSFNPRNSFKQYDYGKSIDEQKNFERMGFSFVLEDFSPTLNIICRKSDFMIDYVVRNYLTSKNNVIEANDFLKYKSYGRERNEYYEQVIKQANDTSYTFFAFNFSRIFTQFSNFRPIQSNSSNINLSSDCQNLEKVLNRLLKNEEIKEEIVDWLSLLIPGFENIEIVNEPLSGTSNLIIYEKGTNKPFTKNLLSDGTWNILALLTAVYQSNEPQFLCIEEPENGLNPKVQKELVNLFRQKCEDEGHYIWLNTHSQTIVNQLTPKELILVDKVDGETKIKQLTDFDLHGFSMDEAWLTNTFGGGIPW